MKLTRSADFLRTLVALLCVHAAGAANAQGPSYRFELTPFAGYRIGGRFDEDGGDRTFELRDEGGYGLLFNVRARSNGQWQVLYAREDTKLETHGLITAEPLLNLGAEYFHFGGTYQFNTSETRPFVALTLGVSRFDPNPSSLVPENYFSASVGGGVQFRATSRLGVRVEGRAFTTFVENDSDIFCRTGGTTNFCAIRIDGKTLTQWEVSAGLVFRF